MDKAAAVVWMEKLYEEWVGGSVPSIKAMLMTFSVGNCQLRAY